MFAPQPFVEGAPPEASYRFKHALIQDAAYDSLLKSRRQTLHRNAADALVTASGQPEVIAQVHVQRRQHGQEFLSENGCFLQAIFEV